MVYKAPLSVLVGDVVERVRELSREILRSIKGGLRFERDFRYTSLPNQRPPSPASVDSNTTVSSNFETVGIFSVSTE